MARACHEKKHNIKWCGSLGFIRPWESLLPCSRCFVDWYKRTEISPLRCEDAVVKEPRVSSA